MGPTASSVRGGRPVGAQRRLDAAARLVLAALLAACALAAPAALGACGSTVTTTRPQSAPSAPTAPSSPPASIADTFQRDPQMKTIGIIGGVSWASSEVYYRLLNEWMRDRFGDDYSAAILMYSLPFGEFAKQERRADKGDWRPLDATMIDAARRVEAGGADFIIIASNTLNSTGDMIEANVSIPVLRIEDAVGRAVRDRGLKTVALLGTKFTMEEPFYRERLKKYGFKVVTPDQKERDYINEAIFDRLCDDVITDADRVKFRRIIARLVKEEGAKGVILGCTEIPLLIEQKDVTVPTFDSTRLHARAALQYALGDPGAIQP